ncbi:MAG: bile acid:sodium symporter family protein [Bacteroidota bacterium]
MRAFVSPTPQKMEASLLTGALLPASLFIIMLGMGLSLVMEDFRRILSYPKAALIGLGNQLVVLPLIALGICYLFQLPNDLAIGMMLLAACPGGVTSNLISHVSHGDTALSISLTAIGSCFTLFSIPLYVGFAFHHFSNGGQVVDVDELGMLLQVFLIVILPVGIGMLVRYLNESFALRMDRPVRVFSIVLFVLLVFSIILAEQEAILQNFPQIGGATIALNVLTLTVGYYSAQFFRLPKKQAITIAIETGIQNSTLAIVIASTVLTNFSYSIPAGIYGLIMLVSGAFIMYYFGKQLKEV